MAIFNWYKHDMYCWAAAGEKGRWRWVGGGDDDSGGEYNHFENNTRTELQRRGQKEFDEDQWGWGS